MSKIQDAGQAATALEAYFLRRVLSEVRSSEEGLLGGGFAGGMFKEMFDEAVADAMSAAGGVGVADVISKQLDPNGAAASAKHGKTAGGKSHGHAAATSSVAAPAARSAAVGTRPETTPVRPETTPVRPDATPVRPDATTVRPDSRDTGGGGGIHLDGSVKLRPFSPPTSSATPASPPSTRVGGSPGVSLRPYLSATGAARPLTTAPLEDPAAPEGTPVRAAGTGVVKFAGQAGTYGNLVVVDHGGGLETRYAHLAHIGVAAGQNVPAGTAVGQTGTTAGPRLHFEIRRDGQPTDPSREFTPSSLAGAGRPTDWR